MITALLALAAAAVAPTPTPVATPSIGILLAKPGEEAPPRGDSLADVAKRIKLKLPANQPRVINNEAVKQLSEGVELTMTMAPTGGAAGGFHGHESGDERKKAIWQQRYRAAVERVHRLEADVKELESRANRLEQEFYAHDDPVYRDAVIKPAWDKSLTDLAKAKADLEDARKEPNEVLNAARRDGALPGWFRGLDEAPGPANRAADHDRRAGPAAQARRHPDRAAAAGAWRGQADAGVQPMETYFIETWGCQMNVLDSQRLEGLLQRRGLSRVERPRMPTSRSSTPARCARRPSRRWSRASASCRAPAGGRQADGVGLCGCVAEQEGARLLARSPALSFVLGPGRIAQLPAALDAVAAGQRVSVTGFEPVRDYDAHLIARGSGARQYVTVIDGCNQHCTFCVVPYTRGHESSRPLAEIVREVEAVAAAGGKEITLLGQTVNAYRCPATGADFGDLLQAVGATAAAWRIQFVTSHPKFFTDKMIEKMARAPRLGTYLHLPFQAGSDAVLKRMHRGYTREEYLGLVARIRSAMPQVTLSTDVIVGFPGETEADFVETLALVGSVRFGQLYGFVYSPRPRTPALRYPGQVSRSEAGERLERLFEVQAPVQLELNQALIGRSVEVLVDGPAKRGSDAWQGRGPDNRVVNFQGWPGIAHGQVAEVVITGATAHSLLGEARRAALHAA